jgi:hypothetical protein
MAGTPKYKVHDANGEYVAATVDSTLAAALIGAAGGHGWVVKHSGRIVFREGAEAVRAADSIDAAAEIIDRNREELRLAAWQKKHPERGG